MFDLLFNVMFEKEKRFMDIKGKKREIEICELKKKEKSKEEIVWKGRASRVCYSNEKKGNIFSSDIEDIFKNIKSLRAIAENRR